MSNVALIDGDVFCYRLAAAAQEEIDWDGDGETVTNLAKDQARETAFKLVGTWTKLAKCKRPLLIFSDRSAPKTSFRFNIHPHYKANRDGIEKPKLHDFVKEELEREFPNKFMSGLEGDDAMGIIATGDDGLKFTIVTIDKDMLTIPGKVCWLGSKKVPEGSPPEASWEIRRRGLIKPDEADWHWMTQTVQGDSVDNFKGAPGIGAKKVEDYIPRYAGLEANIDNALRAFRDATRFKRYHKSWVNQEAVTGDFIPESVSRAIFREFLMNARCARILRHGEYTMARDTDGIAPLVKLWHPDAAKETWERVW